jgi:hypothetical protein
MTGASARTFLMVVLLASPLTLSFKAENSQKLTKIENRRSSRHVKSDSTWGDDHRIQISPRKLSAL